MSEMIPFGKYRGQPIQVLEHDPQYADWIVQQQWAKERYPQIVNVIINKFGNDEETPDHNAMQAKFMDKHYCAMLAEAVGTFVPCFSKNNREEAFEDINRFHKAKICLKNSDSMHLSNLVSEIEFERNAVDVSFSFKSICFVVFGFEGDRRESDHWNFTIVFRKKLRIELKPVIADDYPAVLRQMRNNGADILVYGEYQGIGVDEKTFREFFLMQKISIVSEKEILQNEIDRERIAVNKINLAKKEAKEFISSRVTAELIGVTEIP